MYGQSSSPLPVRVVPLRSRFRSCSSTSSSSLVMMWLTAEGVRNDGTITEDRINESLRRIFRIKYAGRLDMFAEEQKDNVG